MQQQGSSPQQQAFVAVAVLLLVAFGAGYLVGTRGAGALLQTPGAGPAGAEADLACWFSPKGGCTDAADNEIANATRSIEVQAYSFTSHPIAEALIAAHQRGVEVTVVVDKSEREDRYSRARDVANAGIPIYVDAKHAIAHNKVMVIDGKTVLTGSFNFTHAAEFENADNLLIIHNHPAIAAAYEDNFRHHLGHSDRYEAR